MAPCRLPRPWSLVAAAIALLTTAPSMPATSAPETDSLYVSTEGDDVNAGTMAGTGIDGYRMRNAVIRNNRSHHNHGGGLLVEDSVNVLVKRNKIYGNALDVSADDWWDGGIWLDGGRDVTLVGNMIYDNLGPPILTLKGNDFSGNQRVDVWIERWQGRC